MGVSLFGAPQAPLANEKLEQVLGSKSIDFFRAPARACHQLSHITAAARKIAARKFRAVLS
jgi:hypothetical protein